MKERHHVKENKQTDALVNDVSSSCVIYNNGNRAIRGLEREYLVGNGFDFIAYDKDMKGNMYKLANHATA